MPQREDRISPFIAPWFARFDATVEIEGWSPKKSSLMPAVAAHLLARDPDVMGLFQRDPFPDRPPTQIRMRGYRLAFTDSAMQHRTGRFWRKEPAGNYLPMLYLDESGRVVQSSVAPGDEARRSGDYAAALGFYEQQYTMGNLEAGFRLAEMHMKGLGTAADPARAFALYTELAHEGEVVAEYDLGVSYEYGNGVPVDYGQAATWYRLAARHGSLPAIYSLGALYANDRILPRDDIEGLTLLLDAAGRATTGGDPAAGFILAHEPAQAAQLMERLSPEDIAKARQRAADRFKTPIPTAEPE
jgi:hypothetical protein